MLWVETIARIRREHAGGKSIRAGDGVTGAFVPLAFAPGEAYPFDWSEEWIVLNGTTTKVQVAHMRLCHGRMPFVRVSLRQTLEMVLDAHVSAFAFYRKTLEEFDVSNEAVVRTLHDGDFLATQRNVVLVGGTGTGKTHLATAIAAHCIRQGARG